MNDWQRVLDAAAHGVKQANADYRNLSGGLWLCDCGVENFLEAKIAEEIKRVFRGEIVLQAGYDRFQFERSEASRAYPDILSARSPRVDIAMFNNRLRKDLFSLIEVKKYWNSELWSYDLLRICALLTLDRETVGEGQTRYGALVSFLFSHNKSRRHVNESIGDIKDYVRELHKRSPISARSATKLIQQYEFSVIGFGPFTESDPGAEGWEWGGAIIDIAPKS